VKTPGRRAERRAAPDFVRRSLACGPNRSRNPQTRGVPAVRMIGRKTLVLPPSCAWGVRPYSDCRIRQGAKFVACRILRIRADP